MADDTRFLTRRGDSWYYQRAVPSDLRRVWQGRHPILRALRTDSLKVAQSLRWAENAVVEEEFAKLRNRPRPLTVAEIEARATAEKETTLRVLAELGVDDAGLIELIAIEKRKLSLADPNALHPALTHEMPKLTASGVPIEAAINGVPSRVTDLDYARIRARIAAMEGRRSALRGEVPVMPLTFGRNSVDPVTLQPIVPTRTQRRAVGGAPRFSELAASYVASRMRDPSARLKVQTQQQLESAYRLFASFAGDPPLSEVTRQQAAEFLAKLATLDPAWGKSEKLRKLDFEELVKLKGGHSKGLSNVTINRTAMWLAHVWRYAEKVGAYEGPNPWTNQARPTKAKGGNARKPVRGYRGDELAKLLTVQPAVSPRRHNMASTLPWLILIGAFSGLRLNEICSLDGDNVRQIEGVWCFDITEAKSESGIRIVPVHSRILSAGLVEYRKRIGSGPLYPALKPGGPDGKRSWYAAKSFSKYRRKLGLSDRSDTGKDALNFHSLRHAFTTALRHARIPEDEVAEVVGHKHQTITRHYADRQKVMTLKKVVEAVRYDGLDK